MLPLTPPPPKLPFKRLLTVHSLLHLTVLLLLVQLLTTTADLLFQVLLQQQVLTADTADLSHREQRNHPSLTMSRLHLLPNPRLLNLNLAPLQIKPP